MLAHEASEMDSKEHRIATKVPVKGAVGRIGVEADFTTIVATKCVKVRDLKEWANDLLVITDLEKEDGFKYVFQTRKDEDTMGEKMRSAIDLWDRKEKYIDNDLNKVFNRLSEYYN